MSFRFGKMSTTKNTNGPGFHRSHSTYTISLCTTKVSTRFLKKIPLRESSRPFGRLTDPVLVLLRQRRASRTRLHGHDRADKQATARLALRRKARAAEMLAFPLPSLGADNRRLSSLLREECFSGEQVEHIVQTESPEVLISLARAMLFRVPYPPANDGVKTVS